MNSQIKQAKSRSIGECLTSISWKTAGQTAFVKASNVLPAQVIYDIAPNGTLLALEIQFGWRRWGISWSCYEWHDGRPEHRETRPMKELRRVPVHLAQAQTRGLAQNLEAVPTGTKAGAGPSDWTPLPAGKHDRWDLPAHHLERDRWKQHRTLCYDL